jgi:hypothetical protein
MIGVLEAGSGVRVAVGIGCGVIVLIGVADLNGSGEIEGSAVLTCPEG